jgi:pentatricopeptide repeat protein
MIVALAQAGDVEGAHVHRGRIVEFANRVNVARSQEGGVVYAPSSDAYGALIYNVKDTTDDATNALMLWNEATELGVEPNLYLYNNIISKLARARKADQALELFKQMKERGLSPSSITYGAMIGACVRVGDVGSAEALFTEMEAQRNFKPRVPPFNTMMQLYTTTKPNRERALWFYEEMGRQGVEPTAHTYKVSILACVAFLLTPIPLFLAAFGRLRIG